jgi:hypothetical protein
MTAAVHLNASLARYLDRRLAETVCTDLLSARLYGLEIIDPAGIAVDADGAARFICVAEGTAHALLDGPGRIAAAAHDAVALVTAGWSTPLANRNRINGNHPDDLGRRRVVVTLVGSTEGGIASILRDCESGSATDPGPIVGQLAKAVAALWS